MYILLFQNECLKFLYTGLYIHVHEICVDLCLPASLDSLAYEIIFTGDCRHSRNY